MLGRRRKTVEDMSFALDIVGTTAVLFAVFLALSSFRQEWQALLTFLTGYPFNVQTTAHLLDDVWLLVAIVLNQLIGLRLSRLYSLEIRSTWYNITFEAAKATFLGLALTTIFFYFMSAIIVNRSLVFGFAGVFFCYLLLKEAGFRYYLQRYWLKRNPSQALLVASPRRMAERLEQFRQRERYGSIRVEGVVLTDGSVKDLPEDLHELAKGTLTDLPQLLASGQFELVLLGETRQSEAAQQALVDAETQGVEVWYFFNFLNPLLATPNVDEFGGQPVVVFNSAQHYEGRLIIKRLFDVMAATAIVVAISPLFIALALAVKLTSPGPVFFVQNRTGWRHRPFPMLKFRTMVADAEKLRDKMEEENEMTGPAFKVEHDPRITPIGRFLRRYSLDELPQLINVLRGEMSLVGPRPLPLYETEKFEVLRDHRRYSVLPGLTGLWQISGRSQIEDFSEWVRLDLEYIDKWSLWLDIKILFRTIPVVIRGEGAH